MLRYGALALAAALIPSLTGPSAAIAENSDGSLRSVQPPARSALDNPAGERTTRASTASADHRRPATTLPRPRMSRSGKSGTATRMVDPERPDTKRSAEVSSPHATDPHTPQQAGTRSVPRSVRAPASPTPQRSEPPQPSRMAVVDGTRLTRASFEDWLFGR